MKAALLVTLIVGVSCADVPLLGAEKCTWGPAYWCSSIENARGCGSGSEEHCRTKVWVGDHPLANKITNPIPESKEKKVLDNVKTKLMQNTLYRPLQQSSNGVNDANCALCELIGKKVLDSLTNNATEAEVVQELELVCEVLPASFKDTCTEFVDEYGRMFYEAFLQTADVHELCVFLGLCSEEFTRIMQSTEMLTALMGGGTFQDIPCDTCQSLTALVQKEVLANEADIEAMLDQVCPLLPVDQNECDETINQMFEAAVQFFESYSPLEVCQLVGLCEDAAANAVFGLEPVQFGQEGQTGVAAEDNMVF